MVTLATWTLCLLYVGAAAGLAQITYVPGKYTTAEGENVVGLVKDREWQDNPSEVSFKETIDAAAQTFTTDDILGFSVDGGARFVRATVPMDRSSVDIRRLSTVKEQVAEPETVFLREVVTGPARLYQYTDGKRDEFFYALDGEPITPLVYTLYTRDGASVRYNERYKQQLTLALTCGDVDASYVEYDARSLARYVTSYNVCMGAAPPVISEAGSSRNLRLRLRPGLLSSDLNAVGFGPIGFDRALGYRLGVDVELLLRVNRNKWSLFAEPTFASVELEGSTERTARLNTTFTYRAFDLPMGVRHYFFLPGATTVSIDLGYVLAAAPAQQVSVFGRGPLDLDRLSGNAFASVGGEFRERYGVVLRYNASRELLRTYVSAGAGLTSLSAILSYRFL